MKPTLHIRTLQIGVVLACQCGLRETDLMGTEGVPGESCSMNCLLGKAESQKITLVSDGKTRRPS